MIQFHFEGTVTDPEGGESGMDHWAGGVPMASTTDGSFAYWADGQPIVIPEEE